jgi:hypothetical protein
MPQPFRTVREQIRDAIANPASWPEWRLGLLRSDANFLRMHREESALRAIIADIVAKRLAERESAPFTFLEKPE